MGFNLIRKNKSNDAKNNLTKTLSRSGALVLFLFATSCMPSLKEKAPTTDKEVSVDEVADAIGDGALGERRPVEGRFAPAFAH